MSFQALNGERLVDLRNLLGLSQTSLAERLGVKQAFVSLVERGDRPLAESMAADAARTFDVPESFFTVPSTLADSVPVTFRKKAAASVKDERRIVSRHKEATRTFRCAGERSGYRECMLPAPKGFEGDPILLAEEVRNLAGLENDDPVPNVTRLMERLGVGVLEALEVGNGEDADHISISRPADSDGRPLVALAATCSGEMARMSLAHELGHLIFDGHLARSIKSTRAPEEKRAYRFASALLVSDNAMRRHVSESLTLHGYLPLKARFGISVAALIVRARDMGLISESRARSLHIQRSSQGWTKHEPVTVRPESALLFTQCYDKSFPDWNNNVIADHLGTMTALLDEWMPTHSSEDQPIVSLAEWRERRQRQTPPTWGSSPHVRADDDMIEKPQG